MGSVVRLGRVARVLGVGRLRRVGLLGLLGLVGGLLWGGAVGAVGGVSGVCFLLLVGVLPRWCEWYRKLTIFLRRLIVPVIHDELHHLMLEIVQMHLCCCLCILHVWKKDRKYSEKNSKREREETRLKMKYKEEDPRE
jgi:hypothetical protein